MTTSATSKNVSASWDDIECIERNGMITNYVVEFQELSGGVISGEVMNQTFTASGLTPYTWYTLRVAGVNIAGRGTFSDIVFVTTAEDGNNSYVHCYQLPIIFYYSPWCCF